MHRRIPLAVLALASAFATTAAGSNATPAKPGPFRILYASDWSGTSQIYAFDPTTGTRGQLTFGPAPACLPANPCGYVNPIPSPDGRRVLFRDRSIQGPFQSSLFVGRADGRLRRRLAPVGTFSDDPSWSPDSRRIAYAATDGLHIANADGSGDRRVDKGDDSNLAWSPDGRSVAFTRLSAQAVELVVLRGGAEHVVGTMPAPADIGFAWSPSSRWLAYSSLYPSGELTVVHSDGSGRRTVASAVFGDYAWSPTGSWIAYSSADTNELDIAHPDGSGRRRLFAARVAGLAWSADGQSLAFCCDNGLLLANVATGSLRVVTNYSGGFSSWSPRGHVLAYAGSDGIHVASAGTTRLITRDQTYGVTWSPGGTSFAYLAVPQSSATPGGSLRVANLTGRVRTVVTEAGAYGGRVWSFTWTRPPIGVRYRKPAPRTLATVTNDELTAPWPIQRIAADGDRIAYVACGHVFSWKPATKAVVQAEPVASLAPECQAPTYYTSYYIYSLAVDGDRVAFGDVQGGNGRSWWLGGTVLGRAPSPFTLGHGVSTNGGAYGPGPVVGELAAAGDLLVFGSWAETRAPGSFGQIVTTVEDVQRAVPGGCPCPTVASTPGPLVPFDVDGGRIVAVGDDETWLLDSQGTRLRAVPVSAAAAQLSGSDLVILTRGELRDYDAGSGALHHTWPLPDVPNGGECATPNQIRCNTPPPLLLQDAARGLVTYVLDGKVHLLRLADGADATVADGTRARFMNAGLVYAEGSVLRVVPYDLLPLR